MNKKTNKNPPKTKKSSAKTPKVTKKPKTTDLRELTSVEQFYVQANRNKSVGDLANEIGCSVESVIEFVNKGKGPSETVTKKEEYVDEQGYYHKKGSTVATEAASSNGDGTFREPDYTKLRPEMHATCQK